MAVQTQQPKISVIMVDGGYRPHFEVMTSLNKQTMATTDYEVLWIEYFDRVQPELVDKINLLPNSRVYTLNLSGIYHSSICFNYGITHALGELLVIVDADVLMEDNFLETLWQEHLNHDRLVMYIFRFDEPHRTTPYCFDMDYLKKNCTLTNPYNYGGCLTVRKKWLLEINGYECCGIFHTGGDHANGLDVFTRFKNLGLPVMWHPHLRLYHPWHPHVPGIYAVYKPQLQFIEHRAKNLEVLPYQGIHQTRNREIPAGLLPLLNEVTGARTASSMVLPTDKK